MEEEEEVVEAVVSRPPDAAATPDSIRTLRSFRETDATHTDSTGRRTVLQPHRTGTEGDSTGPASFATRTSRITEDPSWANAPCPASTIGHLPNNKDSAPLTKDQAYVAEEDPVQVNKPRKGKDSSHREDISSANPALSSSSSTHSALRDSTLPPPPSATIDHPQQPRPEPQIHVDSPPGPKLCGYLHKQGGPLRAWKLRWFTYEEKKSHLFYYRAAQDVTPLGCVGLCSATLTYPLKGETGTFHIQTPERTFILKAATQEAMMYWLQQLQQKRWQHRDHLTGQSATGTPAPSAAEPHSQDALLCASSSNNNNNCPEEDFLPLVKTPPGLVGEGAANLSAPLQWNTLSNVSIKHPLIEIQNSMHSLLSKRSSQEVSQSVFHIEAPTWTPPNSNRTSSSSRQDVPLFTTSGRFCSTVFVLYYPLVSDLPNSI
ncbi:uncharacterized protein FYW47_000583 [Aplochiton taeniatus]